MTRRVLLRCDNTGDLYPVTKPSTVPHAILTSQYTWHQYLGHPGSEVLQRILSRNLISCTKEKPPILCHACQLGKHVKLPFASYNTLVKSSFDVVHSDLWTSPILSLSGFKYYVLFLDHYSQYNRPPEHLNLHVSSISPLPKSYTDAFNGPNWQNAMQDEYNVFNKNNTWTLMPRPTDANIARCMWSFHHKYLADGTLSCYKARLIANGSTQIEGVDVDETFSPVVKPGTIRTVLSLATSRHWPVHQLDVKNTFLHGDLAETVYMYQPLGFRDSTHPDYLYRTSTASFESMYTAIIAVLHPGGFSMTDLGSLNYFLGSLQYLTFTRLDISYAVQQMRIRLVVLLLDDQLQVIVAEAKYRGVANAIAETCWLRNLLRELHTPLYSATLVYCDNVSAVYLSSNSVQHQRTKHIEIDIHFVRDLVAAGQVRVLHIPSHYQIMPPKMMKRKAVKKMVKKRIVEAIEEYEKTKANPGNASGGLDQIERYIRGFPKRIKGNITSLRPTTLHDAINMAHELVEQAVQGKAPRPQLRIGVILGIYQSAIVTTLTTIDNALQSVRGAKELVIRSKTAELRFQVQVLTPCGM
ncbi:ribonuclease H-like domain-containing protein [Tanacetum coccineum]